MKLLFRTGPNIWVFGASLMSIVFADWDWVAAPAVDVLHTNRCLLRKSVIEQNYISQNESPVTPDSAKWVQF